MRALFGAGASFTVVRRDVAERIGHVLPIEVKKVIWLMGRRG